MHERVKTCSGKIFVQEAITDLLQNSSSTIMDKIFETNSSFHVIVQKVFTKTDKFSFWKKDFALDYNTTKF